MVVLSGGERLERARGRRCGGKGMLIFESFAEAVVLKGGEGIVLANTSNY